MPDLIPMMRRLWIRLMLRGAQFTGRYGRLKALYAVADPWDLGSSREQGRFTRTNALVAQVLAPPAPAGGTLLEIGCGEGFQTAHLLRVCGTVTGIEVSPQAAERARQRCPAAEIVVGRMEDAASLMQGRRFDLVTAFEVLYYARDTAAILASLQTLAPRLLVTNYHGQAGALAPLLDGPGWQRLPDLEAEGTRWRCDLWTAPPA